MTTPTEKTAQVIDEIFRDSALLYGLKEFEGVAVEDVLAIREIEPGRFYLKDLKTGSDRFVFDRTKQQGKPEEIIRQLWLYVLHRRYGYPLDRIETEKSIHFGREVHKKSADVVVTKADGITPYIIVEVKKPNAEEGIEQLKSYLNAEGCEIGVWSNGVDRVILYRNYPNQFEDTLPDIPPADKSIDDFLEEPKTLSGYTNPGTDLRHTIEIMQELVLANAGVDVFNEVFKLIYAKLFDELEATKRPNQEILFRKWRDPERTYQAINRLFKQAIAKWPGIFFEQEEIRLSPEHLSVVVGELEKTRLFGTDLQVIDEAFEYLIPEVAKGKKGQYFTPRHVIQMAVKMLNPKSSEYILDPAAGSGGFLIATMNWVGAQAFPGNDQARHEYAQTYLYGIDFADETAKVSRALMLIAGDGRSHLLKLNSLDPREWQGESDEKLHARRELRQRLAKPNSYDDQQENERTFKQFAFDLVLTNPPFAGEIRDSGVLRQYLFGKRSGKIVTSIERHLLFIERVLEFVKPGGRIAIVLPQGVLNNTTLKYVREFLLEKARLLAVVGLHVNTFKPHTGTKTSVLFLQRWGGEAGDRIADYPIFVATSTKPGKDSSGDYVYKKGTDGQPVHDQNFRRVLDHDLDEIANAFILFAKEQKLSFWEE